MNTQGLQIKPLQSHLNSDIDKFKVVDENNYIWFSGTYTECETWIDINTDNR